MANANIRFDNKNVAYVNVDKETHNMTGGVMDETTGTFYPVGGGGTEITNPILTINVDASGVVGEVGSVPLIQFNDGSLQNVDNIVNGGSTYAFEGYVLEDVLEGEENEYWWICPPVNTVLDTNKTLSVSNEVNVTVTLNQGSGIFQAMITDPTQPASFTLTVTN